MTSVVVRAAAAADLEQARRYYEGRRDGLGDEFLDDVSATMAEIGAAPNSFQVVHRSARRALLRRFPYGDYVPDGDGVVVVAVMHVRRKPSRWQRRT